jgi:hypothetical protein
MVFFIIAMMLLSGIAGFHGSTDIMMGLSAKDLQIHPLSKKRYLATSIRDDDTEKDEKRLTDIIILLDDGYELQNIITALDKTYDSSWMRPIDAYKKFVDMAGRVPADEGHIRITPIANKKNELIGWLFFRDTDVDIVHWWINKEGIVTLGITYNDLSADAVMASEDKERDEWN